MKSSTRIFLLLTSASALLFSLPCIGMTLNEIVSGQPNIVGNLLLLFFFALVSLPAMFALYKAIKTPGPAAASTLDDRTENLILQMARIRHGRVSATHVAMQTPLTIDQATRALNELEQQGVVYREVTLHGGTEFIFPDLLEPTDRFQEFDKDLARDSQNTQDHHDNYTLDLDDAAHTAESASHAQSTHSSHHSS